VLLVEGSKHKLPTSHGGVKGSKLLLVEDDFERVRREPDPVARGRQATALLALYQQRSTELARIRRVAIEEARDVLGGSYTEVAKAFGLTKGRITQIRNTAPPAHRAFFGVGPLAVALPGRTIQGREELVIAGEDDTTGVYLTAELDKLSFITERVILDPREEWEPNTDAVIVCGPSSAHIGHVLMQEDPYITMSIGDGASWYIVDQDTGERFLSPRDREDSIRADHAYIAHRIVGDRVIVHIAGLHALGSIGAAHYIINNLADLYSEFGDRQFSMAVTSHFDGMEPTSIEVLIPPRLWG
jgi:hypothetical protein